MCQKIRTSDVKQIPDRQSPIQEPKAVVGQYSSIPKLHYSVFPFRTGRVRGALGQNGRDRERFRVHGVTRVFGNGLAEPPGPASQ